MSTALLRRGEWLAAFLAFVIAALLLRAAPGTGGPIVAAAGIAAIAVWIVWQDLATFTISDAALIALASLACGLRASDAAVWGVPARVIAPTLVLDALLPGGAMLLLREYFYRRRGTDGLGLGDVKLAGAGGLLVGTLGFAWALFAASMVALGGVATLRLLRPANAPAQGSRIAFGAVLAPAIVAVWLAERCWPAIAAAIGP